MGESWEFEEPTEKHWAKPEEWNGLQETVKYVADFKDSPPESSEVRTKERKITFHGSATRTMQTWEEMIPRKSEWVSSALMENGFTFPLSVQIACIPSLLTGKDLIGKAKTGSGKTMAYLIPAICHLERQGPIAKKTDGPIALILGPTRELVVQIKDEANKLFQSRSMNQHYYSTKTWWVADAVFGGTKRVITDVNQKTHLIAATPGRLYDDISRGKFGLKHVSYFALDEADRMLDDGFKPQVQAIADMCRPDRQTVFFSATWDATVEEFARTMASQRKFRQTEPSPDSGKTMCRIVVEDIDKDKGFVTSANKDIEQSVFVSDPYMASFEKSKEEKLNDIIREILEGDKYAKILVFVATRKFAEDIAWGPFYDQGWKCAPLHGKLKQDKRLDTLEDFRAGKIQLLVATDVVGRGIDIPHCSHVIVYEFGNCLEDYVHRIGRTCRGVDGRGASIAFWDSWKEQEELTIQFYNFLKDCGQTIPETFRAIVERDQASIANGTSGDRSKTKPAYSHSTRGWNETASKSKRSWNNDDKPKWSNGNSGGRYGDDSPKRTKSWGGQSEEKTWDGGGDTKMSSWGGNRETDWDANWKSAVRTDGRKKWSSLYRSWGDGWDDETKDVAKAAVGDFKAFDEENTTMKDQSKDDSW